MTRDYERKTQKGQWTQEQLQKALDAIKSGKKIRQVARTFGIHEATLRTRLKAKNTEGPKLGRNPTFSNEQENEIKDHVIKMAKLFYGISCFQLRKIAFEYAEANKIPNNFDKTCRLAGKDWVALFLKRNPSISLRKPEPTSINRIQAFNQEDVNAYFKNLEHVFEKYKFKEGRVFNVDETGINTVQKPERILAPKGVKQIGGATSWERGKNVTAICCFSAAGTYVPPMFIFPRKRMSSLLSKGGPVGAIYGCSVNGWSNESLFLEWIQHFQNNVKSTVDDPVLLILDNHGSHVSLDIFEFCKKNCIVMVTIPPHTSHKLQPLDVTFYSSLKSAFNRECDLYMKSRVYEKITPYELAELFNKAYIKVATMDKGQSGFKACGICPFNPDKFQHIDLEQSDTYRDIVLEDEELPNETNGNEAVASTKQPDILERSQEQLPGSSAQEIPILVEEVSTKSTKRSSDHVSVSDIYPIPKQKKVLPKTNQAKGKRKGKSLILTATPEKEKRQMELSIKKEKEVMKKKAEEDKKRKLKEKADKCPNLKLQKGSKKKQMSYKKKLDDIDPTVFSEDVCLFCGEFGKDGELWYRCILCSMWSHQECSGWNTPNDYICDVCYTRK